MRIGLVHGFTQAGAAWAPAVPAFERAGHTVFAPDLPGHGSRGDVRATLAETAELLASEPADVWVGYSLGGRVVLQLAVTEPRRVPRMVLVSATAGIEDPAERRARRLADEALADHVEATPIEAFIDEWLSAPMWRTLPPARAQRDVRCRNTPAGLASSLRLAGQGAQQPVWDRLHTITAPTLVVTGEHDAKFAALGDRLAAGIAAADRLTIAGAGHAVPWEQPERFADEVIRWLAR